MAARPAAKGRKGTTKAAPRRGTAEPTHPAASGVAFDAEEIRKRSELLWDTPHKATRGPKAALSRDDVVAAAIRVADEGDLAALTMHAVAAQLGYTPMALYRYFPNKEALVDAAVDAALGAPPRRDGPHEGWRAEIRHWACAKREMLCARPWLAELPFVAAPHGPNWLSWHEAFLRTIAHTGLTPEDMMDVLSVVHGYVHGSADTIISLSRATARGVTPEQWAAAVGADLSRAIGDPRYPMLSGILTSTSGGITEGSSLPTRDGKQRTMDESFDWGLQRVLDGIERYLATD
ncbi:MAG: TetR/AcrR family transcriptional regulator C-terminal domain-containing protein [Gemmatimonadaceae bacterium]|nr:TetR/AcrR family transcriptional regulator C-terminal domain-containing protein [Gemmatimonadaceae bacterium]